MFEANTKLISYVQENRIYFSWGGGRGIYLVYTSRSYSITEGTQCKIEQKPEAEHTGKCVSGSLTGSCLAGFLMLLRTICPGNGVAHSRQDCPASVEAIKTILHRHTHCLVDLENSSIENS